MSQPGVGGGLLSGHNPQQQHHVHHHALQGGGGGGAQPPHAGGSLGRGSSGENLLHLSSYQHPSLSSFHQQAGAGGGRSGAVG
ncbi:hypothetical protein CSUI_011396, partial [Cystoisospora suis]